MIKLTLNPGMSRDPWWRPRNCQEGALLTHMVEKKTSVTVS